MLNRLMKNSGVYEAITRDVLLGEKTGSGIIPYINSVMDVLIDEVLKGRTIDERFGKHLRHDVKELIRKTGLFKTVNFVRNEINVLISYYI